MPHIAAILLNNSLVPQYNPGYIVESMLRLAASDVPSNDSVIQSSNAAMGVTGISDVDFPDPLLYKSQNLLVGLCGESEEKGPSDTWAVRLAQSYTAFGHKSLHDWLGPSQRIIIDLNTQTVHAATDHCGLAFVYYISTDKFVAVSSAMRAFLALPWLQTKLSEISITDILNFGFVLGEDTILEGVQLLSPGKSCEGQIAKPFKQNSYWQPDLIPDARKTETVIHDYQTAFTDTIVKQASQFDGARWGVSLSGGFDSRVCIASFRNLFPDVIPKAITYGAPQTYECIRAQEVAKTLGLIEHHIQPIQYSDLVLHYPQALWQTDGMANIEDCYLASQFTNFHKRMNVRLDGFLGDAHWGGTYLHQSILGAQKFEDVFPWISEKLGFSSHIVTKLLKPPFSKELVSIGYERINKLWNEFDKDIPAVGRAEWLLYLTRGRRYIYQHHGNLFQGTLYSVRPFMGLRCVELCFKTPAHERIHHKIYKEWMNEYYSNIAHIGTPPEFSNNENFIFRLLRLCSYGLISFDDRRYVKSHGWAFSHGFRNNVIEFIRMCEDYLEQYVDINALNSFIRKAPSRSWSFSILAPLMQVAMNHLLFVTGDKKLLMQAHVPMQHIHCNNTEYVNKNETPFMIN